MVTWQHRFERIVQPVNRFKVLIRKFGKALKYGVAWSLFGVAVLTHLS